MRIVVNKHWRVHLDFGRAGSPSLVILNLPRIIAYVVNRHALPTVPVINTIELPHYYASLKVQ